MKFLKSTKKLENFVKIDKIKNLGQIFTPNFLVKNILQKHIIDNSCGNGAFLCEIVKIYINEAKKQNFDNKTIKNHLQTYIHGIEIDENLYQNCIQNLQNLTKNIGKISWDITLGDAFLIEKFKTKWILSSEIRRMSELQKTNF